VDVSDAFFIDSSTLHVLVSAHKLALERGACLRLQLGDECPVKRTFEISGLLEELGWASSREDALNGSAPDTSHDDPGNEEMDRATGKLAVDAVDLDRTASTATQAPFSVQSGREDKTEPETQAA
jgi:hypothetical protein